jgi:uncharacterized hydrophobic protein (TIGR00271 family)
MWPSSWVTDLRERFDLTADMAAPDVIRKSVLAGLRFRGTNLWVLIFAIAIASVGLNVNSAAAITGAMLISPLMGPIVGVGYGVATTDVAMIRVALKNLLIAAGISLATSALYFTLTPLATAGSELLARTTPTAWDVLIALFGGLAGGVALTRKSYTNVVPGVAIATALMPPLCTAGYGIATLHLDYFLGALYLFFINGVFISLATFLVVRFLRVPEVAFADPAQGRRVHRLTWGIALLTALPSVWLGYRIVDRALFETSARRFIDEQLTFPNTYVVARRLDPDARTLNLLLAGQRVSAAQLDSARARLGDYHLRRATLTIRQGMALYDSADAQALRASLLDDLQNRNAAVLSAQEVRLVQLQQALLAQQATNQLPSAAALLREVRVEHPDVKRLGLSWLVQPPTDSITPPDSLLVLRLTLNAAPDTTETGRLTRWLRLRTGRPRVQLLLDAPPAPIRKIPARRTRSGRR